MRYFAEFLLIVLFAPLFLIGVLAATFKFQLLDPQFWITSFTRNNVYTKFSDRLKSVAEDQTRKGGGSVTEAGILIGLITPANLKDVIDKNLTSALNFVNGKAPEVIVYVPLDKLPAGLIPVKSGKIQKEMPLAVILSEFNVQGIGESQIQSFSKVGAWFSYGLVLDLTLLILVIVGIFVISEKGKRFVGPGIAFIFAGFLTLAATGFGYVIRSSMFNEWVKGTEPSQLIMSTFAPYILGEVLKLWLTLGAITLALGIALFFVKKTK